MTRTKIVATIGPRTQSPKLIKEMVTAGMRMARLNGSHGTLEWHADIIKILRSVVPELPVLLDIPGKKIRTAVLKHEPSFNIGDVIILTTNPKADGTKKVPITSDNIHEFLQPGANIFADDGMLQFSVVKVEGADIYCRAEVSGTLRSRKGINIPNLVHPALNITETDRRLIQFACDQEVDFIGISFVDSAKQVAAIRKLVGDYPVRIVSKIENQAGLDLLEEIVLASDLLMIDRGDLSMETNLESVAVFQKRIIELAQENAKPVIVATEMLHSMIKKPLPTKSEISDITNAVLDGASALMLSGETAFGKYPVEAIKIMNRISEVAEEFLQGKLDQPPSKTHLRIPQVMGDAIALVCRQLPITKIVAITVSGYAARAIAARQPRQPIIAVTNDPKTKRSLNIIPGTTAFLVDFHFSKTSTDHIPASLEAVWRAGMIVDEDFILVTAVAYPNSGNRMNMMETHSVADFRKALGWKI